MKTTLPFLLFLPLGLSSIAHAQFRERPSTGALRASRLATHVEGNLRKVLDLAVDGHVSALSFSPKGDYLAVATATTLMIVNETGTRKLLVWDALKEKGVVFEDRPPLKAVLTFSPDGGQLFFCGPQGLAVWRWADKLSLDQSPVRQWAEPNIYNLAFVDGGRVVCAAKKGSTHFVQLRDASNGNIIWEKQSGLLPLTAFQSFGAKVRAIVGTATGTQSYWNEWDVSDGKPSFPVDLGAVNAFSGSFSPDGKWGAVVSHVRITAEGHHEGDSRALQILTLETGESKMAVAPTHSLDYAHHYYDYYPGYSYWWYDDWSIDTGWATLFSPDGKIVVTLGKEAVFYDKSSGIIEGRIYFSNDPFPDVGVTQAEADGIGSFSADGANFALVRQPRVTYSSTYNTANEKYEMRRQVQGDSAVEVYALGR